MKIERAGGSRDNFRGNAFRHIEVKHLLPRVDLTGRRAVPCVGQGRVIECSHKICNLVSVPT
jgi:hypothetical protein